MKRALMLIAMPWLLLVSNLVSAACEAGDDRFRSQYQIRVPYEGLLLRIRPGEENVLAELSGPNDSFWSASPGGAAIDHMIVLEGASEEVEYTLCLYARYHKARPSDLTIEQTPLADLATQETTLWSTVSDANRLWAEDTFESREHAIHLFRAAASQARSVSDELLDTTLLLVGKALLRQSEFAKVHEVLNDFNTEKNNPAIAYKLAWLSGETYLRLNQPQQAIVFLQEAIETVNDDLNGSPGVAARDLVDIRILLAESYLTLRQIDNAQEQIDMAAEGASVEYRLLGRLYDVLGFLAIRRSEQAGLSLGEQRQFLADAIDIMLAGKAYSTNASDPVPMAAFENNLGFVYGRLGEHQRALFHYRNILDTVDPQEHPLVYRFAYSNLGRQYQLIADYDRSESYYRQAIELSEASSGSVSTTRCALGATLRLGGDIDAALTEQQRCLRQAESSDSHPTQVLARYEMAEIYLAQGNLDLAWDHARWAWQQTESGVSPAMRARVARLYAWLLQRRGEQAQALSAINTILADHDSNALRLSVTDIVENYAMAMQIANKQGAISVAEQHGLQAIHLIEEQYEQLESERQGPAWSSRTHQIYVQLAEIYLHDYFTTNNPVALQQAFEITERSRAVSLRQHIAGRLAYSDDSSISRAAEQAQIDAISRIANQYATTSGGAGLDGSAVRLPANYYHHQDVLSLHRLQDLTDVSLPPSMSLDDIQAGLRAEQAALYYLLTDENSYVFTVTSETLVVDILSDPESINESLTAARQLLADANASPYSTLAQLSGHLLPPLVRLQEKQELLIVLHGVLHTLPFSALPIPGSNNYQPLVSRFAVQVLPSLTTYLMDKPFYASVDTTDIAIFADPVFDASQLREQVAVLERAEDTSVRGWSGSLQRLPNTALEASRLTQLFGEDRTRVFTGQRASRSNLDRHDVRHAKVLHIATHGYFNSANDDNVGLGFSVIDEDGKPDSGFVTLPELFSYRFNNDLVVISGCDTAMGRPLAGEGLIGLTRGFIAQGARHVISTLWPVSDRASADFMAIFYRQLLALDNVTKALQAAQLEMQQNSSYRNPFYWAAYVLTSVSPDQTLRAVKIDINP